MKAVKTGDTYEIALACAKAVEEWSSSEGYWPDDWGRWQRAFDDAMVASGHPGGGPDIQGLRLVKKDGELLVMSV